MTDAFLSAVYSDLRYQVLLTEDQKERAIKHMLDTYRRLEALDQQNGQSTQLDNRI